MSFSDPIGDMLARIKNSQSRNYKKIQMPNSKFKVKIAEVLKNEGYIIDYKVSSDEKKPTLEIILKYNYGSPVISSIQRISKPGRRIYTKADSIPKIQSGLGIAIVSTSRGIMSGNDAKSKNIGGEIICSVF